MKILGYYVEKDAQVSANTVLVAIDNGDVELTCYCPTEQHCSMTRAYLKECTTKIDKETYIEASKLFFTPSDYL
jgi:hypothetical protein